MEQKTRGLMWIIIGFVMAFISIWSPNFSVAIGVIVLFGLGIRDIFLREKATDTQDADGRRSEKKEKQLQDLLEVIRERGEIENKDVEKILGVSDATAERYLAELEEQGKIEQIGKTGTAVSYRIVK